MSASADIATAKRAFRSHLEACRKPRHATPAFYDADALIHIVCDWWRRDGDRLAENWIFVDIPHVLLQMDVNIFATLEEAA